LECSVGEVAVREARLPSDDAAVDSLTPEVTVAMVTYGETGSAAAGDPVFLTATSPTEHSKSRDSARRGRSED